MSGSHAGSVAAVGNKKGKRISSWKLSARLLALLVTEAFVGVTAGVGKVRTLIDEVSDASRQQSDGIGQVTEAVHQMERVTQTTAARAEESAAARS